MASFVTVQEMMPQIGKVRIQAVTISRLTPHLTAENLFVAPTPTIEALIVCVVLKGIPKCDAIMMVNAAPVSAANP